MGPLWSQYRPLETIVSCCFVSYERGGTVAALLSTEATRIQYVSKEIPLLCIAFLLGALEVRVFYSSPSHTARLLICSLISGMKKGVMNENEDGVIES